MWIFGTTIFMCIHMASLLGVVKIGTGGLLALWLACFSWLILVLTIHYSKNEPQKRRLKKIDIWLRLFIVSGVSAIAIYSFFQSEYILAPYISYKLLIVCTTILCGLGIRYHLAKFTPAFIKLMSGDESDEVNRMLKRSMNACLPYVYGIWAGLFVSSALGLHLI